MNRNSWEYKLYRQAREHRDSATHWRSYDHRGRKFYLNVKDYNGFPSDFSDRLCARYRIDQGTAAEILETVYRWHQEIFWEDADESARFLFLKDESGWGVPAKDRIIESGGRGGGWVTARVPILSDKELSETPAGLKAGSAKDWRIVVKWARSVGSIVDYLLSWEAVLETVKGNGAAWDLEEPEDREVREFSETYGELARASD